MARIQRLNLNSREFQQSVCTHNGQRSPIHDHRGTSCAVPVVRGAAAETRFDMTAQGHVYPTSTRTLPEGHFCATQDNDITSFPISNPAKPIW